MPAVTVSIVTGAGAGRDMSAAGESDAEEGEIVDDEDEAEEAADDKHTTSTTSTTQQHSSKSTSCDKNKKSGSKSGRDSSSRKSSGSSGRKRQKESDGDADRAKRARESEESDSSSGGDDEPATKQRLMMQMMQIMLNASKQGKKSDRKTIELMDKMIKRGSDVSAKEVRDMVRKNKRLLRTGSRDRRSRSRSRDRRSRSRRPDPDDHKSKFPRVSPGLMSRLIVRMHFSFVLRLAHDSQCQVTCPSSGQFFFRVFQYCGQLTELFSIFVLISNFQKQ